MKKGPVIGIGVGITILVIVVGIGMDSSMFDSSVDLDGTQSGETTMNISDTVEASVEQTEQEIEGQNFEVNLTEEIGTADNP